MSNSISFNLALIESKLKGKTLLVYWYLLKSSSLKVGVREVQRALRFSSPSIAVFHLEKLRSLGLLKKERGEYILVQDLKVGILRFFIRIGRFLIPRYLFYSLLLSTMLVSYVILYGVSGCVHNVAAILLGSVASVILWFETLRLWKERPF